MYRFFHSFLAQTLMLSLLFAITPVYAIEAPPVPTPTTTTTQGGGYASMSIPREKLTLNVEKRVSKDGANFMQRNWIDKPLVIPRGKKTRIYAEVKVTNKSPLTGHSIVFDHSFDAAKSSILMPEGIEHVKGINYNSTTGLMTIPELWSGKSVTFTYDFLLEDGGHSDSQAVDSLTLISIDNTLPLQQRKMSYPNIGEAFSSYFVPEVLNPLEVKVTSRTDSSYVYFYLTVKNNGKDTLTSLQVSHFYDKLRLKVAGLGGGRAYENEIRWKRARLRAGESFSLSFYAQKTGTEDPTMGITVLSADELERRFQF